MTRSRWRTKAPAWPRIEQVLDRRVLVTRAHQPREPGARRAGRRAPELVQGGTRLFLVKVLNDAGVTAPLGGPEPEHRPRLRAAPATSPEPQDGADRGARARSVGRHLDLHAAADASAAVRPRDRIRRSCRSTAATPASARRSSASTSAREPRTSGSATTSKCCSPRGRRIRCACNVRDEHGLPTTAGVPDARRARSHLSEHLEAAGAGLSTFSRRSTAPTAKTISLPEGHVHRHRLARPGVRARRRGASSVGGPIGADLPAAALDRSVAVRLVFRRSPHPLRRLLALRESDRRRAAARTCGRRSSARRSTSRRC